MGTLVRVGYDLDHCLKLAHELGVKYIELWIDRNHFWPENISNSDISEILSKLDSYGVKAVSTCPIPFISRDWQTFEFEYNLASPTELLRSKAVKWYKSNITLASELEASVVVVVPGKVDEPNFMKSNNSYRQHWSSLIKSLKECAKHAEDLGVVLGIENTVVSNFINLPGEMRLVVDEVASENVKAYLDIANANVYLSPEIYIDELQGRLCDCIHATDNDGTYPNHLPISMGTIDYESVIKKLRKIGWNGYLLPEIFYDKDVLTHVKNTIDKLRQLIY
ncbi:MAG: sugar phosphate isomerase/epimerase family protein [Nitrososphaerota archaeon]